MLNLIKLKRKIFLREFKNIGIKALGKIIYGMSNNCWNSMG